MDKANKYGQWLLDSRKTAGLTQKELAAKAEIAPSYVSTLERGKQLTGDGNLTRIDLEKCDRISIALGRPIIEGRAAAGYVPETDQEFQAIALDLSEMSEENRREAFAKIERITREYKKKESRKAQPTGSPSAASKERKILL